ncbi:MAG: lysophospholipid acyltransferase family protein [Thermoleophilia bacterium]
MEHVPDRGGLVIAANHFSAIDPPLVGSFSPRAIYYMAKSELMAVPVVGTLLGYTGAFSVRRGQRDREALRKARWLLHEGHAVGLFVEGTRQRLGYPGPVQPGATMLAVQEGVPMVPCGVASFGWTPTNRMPCCVVWGEPIHLGDLPRTSRGYREAAEIVGQRIHELWRHAELARASGYPERLEDGSRRREHIGRGEGAPVRGLRPWPAPEPS